MNLFEYARSGVTSLVQEFRVDVFEGDQDLLKHILLSELPTLPDSVADVKKAKR